MTAPPPPTPVVRLSSADLASTAAGTGPLVLTGLSVDWGRSEPFDQPDPATARLSLFDATGTWATTTDPIGQIVSLRWEGVNAAGDPVSQVFFYGRVTAVRPVRRPGTGGEPDATIVALTCAGMLTDTANRVPSVDWPAETVADRRNRINPFLGGAVVGGAEVRGTWAAAAVAAVPATQQSSAWDALRGLYTSCGSDRFTYLPATRRATFVVRRAVSRAVELVRDPAGAGTARAGKGAYLRTVAIAAAEGLPFEAHYIDGRSLQLSEDALSRDMTARVTRAEVNHPDAAAGGAQRTETVLVSTVTGAEATDEAVVGVRALRADSVLTANTAAQLAAADLASWAAREGAGWRIDTIRWDTTRDGAGFEYFEQFANLALVGGEVQSAVFLQRTWLSAVGVRPVVGIIGGRIAYDGGWHLELDVMPITTGTVAQHPITWEEIDDGTPGNTLVWTDGDDPAGLHESLTLDDLYYCPRGLGVTSTPPNQGWDYTAP